MKQKGLILAGLALVVPLGMTALYLLFVTGASAFSRLVGDFDAVLVAVASASVMALVGASLTFGNGRLSGAGQLEKISVWAALLMSTVSAITTSLGLLSLLKTNAETGSLLTVLMAGLLSLGIQLSMLMYALRISDSVQRLAPATHLRDAMADDAPDDRPLRRGRRAAARLVVLLPLVLLGLALISGLSLAQLASALAEGWNGLDGGMAAAGLGGVLLIAILAYAVIGGLIRKASTWAGLVMSVAIYFGLLMFSSGFGYMAYFLAGQSDVTRALDRDNVIETQTASLVRQINDAAAEDLRDFQREARAGAAYQDLSERIDTMSSLFVANRSALQAQISAYEARRQDLIARAAALAAAVDTAEAGVTAAEQAITRAQTDVTRAQTARETNLPQLQTDLQAAQAEETEARGGRDGTGIAECGPICRSAQRRQAELQAAIERYDTAVIEAQQAESAARDALAEARRRLQAAQADAQNAPAQDSLPPPITDRSSFTTPRAEYNVAPTREGLRQISRACSAGGEMLIDLGLPPGDLPSCDIVDVEVWFDRIDAAEAALVQMQGPCGRSEEEIAQENAALMDGAAPDPQAIPPYLRARLAWMTRCMTAANTGSDRMVALASTINQLESEFTTPGYDPRRVLRSLQDGNLYAIFSLLMAVLVDVAILFAGMAASLERGRDLREDDSLTAPDRIADRVQRALETVQPGAPHRAARMMVTLWKNEPVHMAGGDGPVYTHSLSLRGVPPDAALAARLILDAAADYARYEHGPEGGVWRLRKSFVALIVEQATHGGAATAAGGMLAGNGAGPVQRGATSGITPIFTPPGGGSGPTPPAPPKPQSSHPHADPGPEADHGRAAQKPFSILSFRNDPDRKD
ncbi:hypothetical protein JI664_04445 [Rhodobacter sp. NTK016B]|uniref:hypothetical protein n=2 Tax=Bacteria TaxID=2 RepID=UPI001A8C7B11|nr:hypothetical protein [Rhodobacter sp. NTK016B]MBN8291206.1 hypothetical protein [Rhodobacter sp. NTK016B]